ncbi:two-component system, CitB family, sensor kinase [Nakamurella panacisegetis]|uniref:histidine kinase n=1 Tax=Nakamurella panacisegetis TaxID=1090615 RepID=A0A1H0S9W0_9ACTN|nr:sensor histidine kinase [Nakamurella panacisegetis]SDP37956.1 two-component system, CitB family, sensor kinase [Nakamurella panacisegetis]
MRSIASWMLWSVVGVLVFTAVIGGVLETRQTSAALDREYEQQARVAASAVADIPEVRADLIARDPDHRLQSLAGRLQHDVGAAYVVITDAAGRRYSHPNPAMIGRYLEEPVQVLDGQTHVGINNGSLGRSANGKAPVFAPSGEVIGQVSVGVLETTVSAALASQVGSIATYLAIALALGVTLALLLARAMKRKTFGLELNEISSLLQEREAMLHGVREGVLGFDARGRVTVLNDEARRLLGLSTQVIGRPLTAEVPAGRLRDVLTGEVRGPDLVVLTDDSLLVVNHRAVVIAGRPAGSVVTLRDRTEMEGLIRELDSATGLAKALRAQEHEFANRLHVIGGLLDLQEFAEARSYVNGVVASGHTGTGEDLRARISPPIIAALLLAKQTIAAERDISLTIAEHSRLDLPSGPTAQNVMTVLGNLIDNGLDAVAQRPAPRAVEVTITDDEALTIVVQDNGPGIDAVHRQSIFDDGFSTKAAQSDRRRGIGLALVRRLVTRAGGSIVVNTGPGARFEVHLPKVGADR